MKTSLSNFNSYLSDIETELKQLHEKHSNKPEYNEEDVNRLLDILEELNKKMLDLDTEDDLDRSEPYTFIKWKDGFENLALYDRWIRRFYLPQVYNVIKLHLETYRNFTD